MNKKILTSPVTFVLTLTVIVILLGMIIYGSEAQRISHFRFISLCNDPIEKIETNEGSSKHDLEKNRNVTDNISKIENFKLIRPSTEEIITKEERKLTESVKEIIPLKQASLSNNNNMGRNNTQNVFSLISRTKERNELSQIPEESSIKSLRLAIEDMINTYGSGYPKGENYLAEIDKQLNLYQNAKDRQTRAEALHALFLIRREALLSNPVVCNNPILFVVRNQYIMDADNLTTFHPIAEHEHNGPSIGPDVPNQFLPGGALKIIDLKNGGKVTTILNCPDGVIRDPRVHWDGKKIIFSMRKNKYYDSYHIYEINVDGKGLRQLTFLDDVDDMNPVYLPDDNIVFSSTREPKYVDCQRFIMANIYHMESDGANIYQITKNKLFDKPTDIMPDGRILYDRYEYVDRSSHGWHALWAVNPDGTNQSLLWGNNSAWPNAIFDAHMIPRTQKIIGIFADLHSLPRGAIAIIDRRIDMDGPLAVVRTWPDYIKNFVRGPTENINVDFITDNNVSPLYEDTYPLNDKYFLVSKTTRDISHRISLGESIYLVDIFGNEILLHKEEPGCFDPMPITSRERPPKVSVNRNYENKAGYVYIQNVYEGLDNVPHGTVKFLRVVEAPEKRYWASGGLPWYCYTTAYPGINWYGFETKRILGTVPVEEDGSAYFEVPSDRFVFFQLLDEQRMMIQSMRSGTVLQSGEILGCIGCHEKRITAPSNRMNLALQKPPVKLDGWFGKIRNFNYISEVQPVFDKHCVKCHNYGTNPGKKLNLARDRLLIFNTSYNELYRKNQVTVIGAGVSKTPDPYSWGSHASNLIRILQKGHNDVLLSKEEFQRIATWLDLNGVYYGSYASAYPLNSGGRSPLSPVEEKRLSELTGKDLSKQFYHLLNQGPLVNFDRPSLSPILSGLQPDDKEYKEALEIIEKGKARFSENPDSDMPEFKLSGVDLWREEKYQYRHWIEMKNREAIRKGKKLYDTDQPTKTEWLRSFSIMESETPEKTAWENEEKEQNE
jgi:hypothetical protein